MKLYVVLNYNPGIEGKPRRNVVLLRKSDAELWNEEGKGDGIIEVEGHEIEWMKKAADGACRFREWADTGSIELGTLFHEIEDYEKEVYHS